MRLIIGGAHQGKLDWYLRTSGRSMQQVADGETLPLELLPDRPVLNHLHRWVYRMVQQGKDVQAAMERYLQRFPDAIILCDEVGCGVVPIDPVERQWREETGRLCCLLAQRAQRVERIFCGIAMTLKPTKEDGQNEDHSGAAR